MKNTRNVAEIADRHQNIMMVAFLLMSLRYAASAIAVVVNETSAYYLGWAEIVLIFLAIGIIIPLCAWKFIRLNREERKSYLDPNGYLFSMYKQALARSWAITFIAIAFFDGLGKKLLYHLPPKFFMQAALALMLGSFSIIFFVLSRADGAGDFEEETV